MAIKKYWFSPTLGKDLEEQKVLLQNIDFSIKKFLESNQNSSQSQLQPNNDELNKLVNYIKKISKDNLVILKEIDLKLKNENFDSSEEIGIKLSEILKKIEYFPTTNNTPDSTNSLTDSLTNSLTIRMDNIESKLEQIISKVSTPNIGAPTQQNQESNDTNYKELVEEHNKFVDNYNQLLDENQQLKREVNNVDDKKIEILLAEVSSLKSNYNSVSQENQQLLNELTRVKNNTQSTQQIEQQNQNLLSENDKLKQELAQLKQKIQTPPTSSPTQQPKPAPVPAPVPAPQPTPQPAPKPQPSQPVQTIQSRNVFELEENKNNCFIDPDNFENFINELTDVEEIKSVFGQYEKGGIYNKLLDKYIKNLNKTIQNIDLDDDIEDNIEDINKTIETHFVNTIIKPISRVKPTEFEAKSISTINNYFNQNGYYTRNDIVIGETMKNKDFSDLDFLITKDELKKEQELISLEFPPYYINFKNEDGEINSSFMKGLAVVCKNN